MLIIFNKSGSLLNVDFQYDSFSQGDMNVHDIDVIVLDDNFENYNFNGYVQFLRQGETEPSPKLIMTNKANLMYNEKTYNGYTFRMESDWYTAIAGTLKMTIEIKQYGDNGLASNKAYGIVNIPIQESVSAISQVESTITNEEYNSLLRLMNEKMDTETDNVFKGVNTFENDVYLKKNVTLEGVKDNSYGQETIPLYVYGRDKSARFRVNLPIKNGDVALKDDIPELYDWAKQPNKPTYTQAEVGLGNVNNIFISESSVNQIETNKEKIEEVEELANQALNIANEKVSAIVFSSYSEMISTLKSASQDEYKVGTTLYIREVNVPDYWISGFYSDNNHDTGYYIINELETEKVDLDNFYTIDQIDSRFAKLKNTPEFTGIKLVNTTGQNLITAQDKTILAVDGSKIVLGQNGASIKVKSTLNPVWEKTDGTEEEFAFKSDINTSNNQAEINKIKEDIKSLDVEKVDASSLGTLAYRSNISKNDVGLNNVRNVDSYSKEEADEKFISELSENPEFKSIRLKNETGERLLSVQDKQIISVDSSKNHIKLGNSTTNTRIISNGRPVWEQGNGIVEELATINDLSGTISPVFEILNAYQIKTPVQDDVSYNLINGYDSQIQIGDNEKMLLLNSYGKPKIKVDNTYYDIATIKDVSNTKQDINSNFDYYYTKTETDAKISESSSSLTQNISNLNVNINNKFNNYVSKEQLSSASYINVNTLNNTLNNYVTTTNLKESLNPYLTETEVVNDYIIPFQNNIINEMNPMKTDIQTNMQNITSVQTLAEEAKSIAQGRSSAYVFSDFFSMRSKIAFADSTQYNIGDNIYIEDINTTDYWISNILDNNDGEFGYYEISPLETEKVDLSDYYTSKQVDSQLNSYYKKGEYNFIQANTEGTLKKLNLYSNISSQFMSLNPNSLSFGEDSFLYSVVQKENEKIIFGNVNYSAQINGSGERIKYKQESGPSKQIAFLDDIDNAIGNINSILDTLNGEVI